MRILGSVVAGLFFVSSPAQAAETFTYDFSFTAFGAPQQGNFTLSSGLGGYILTGINYSIGSTVFNTVNTGLSVQGFPSFFLGGTLNGLMGIASNTNDFWLLLNAGQVPGELTSGGFAFSMVGQQTIATGSFSLSAVAAGNSVPEPGTWAMMLLGFMSAGVALRRSRMHLSKVTA